MVSSKEEEELICIDLCVVSCLILYSVLVDTQILLLCHTFTINLVMESPL